MKQFTAMPVALQASCYATGPPDDDPFEVMATVHAGGTVVPDLRPGVAHSEAR